MGILKEFKCPAHGPFESDEPVCSRGCTAGITRAFYTPTSISTGGRTRGIDQSLERIAKEFALTDMNNHGGTTAARVQSPQARQISAQQEAIRRRFPKNWGTLPSADQGGAVAAAQQYGAGPSVDMSMLKDAPKRKVEYITAPGDAELTAKAAKAA